MSKGKVASQAAHASVEAVLKADKSVVNAWVAEGMPKIVLRVESLSELDAVLGKASEVGLIASRIEDDGLTALEPGTVTCGAIGPGVKDVVDNLTRGLKLYS